MAGTEPTRALLIPLQAGESSGGIRISALWNALVRYRYLMLAVGVLIVAMVSAIYVMSDVKYRASTTVVFAGQAGAASALGSLGAQFGGLANLAGVTLPSAGGGRVEAFAALESKELIRRFIRDGDLIPVLYYKKWDPETKTWSTDSGNAPSLEMAVQHVQDNVLSIDREPGSDLAT